MSDFGLRRRASVGGARAVVTLPDASSAMHRRLVGASAAKLMRRREFIAPLRGLAVRQRGRSLLARSGLAGQAAGCGGDWSNYLLAAFAQPAFFLPLAPTHRQSLQPLQENSSLTSVHASCFSVFLGCADTLANDAASSTALATLMIPSVVLIMSGVPPWQ
jgi:hypothetical protein